MAVARQELDRVGRHDGDATLRRGGDGRAGDGRGGRRGMVEVEKRSSRKIIQR